MNSVYQRLGDYCVKDAFFAALVISLAASITLPCHAQAYDNRPAAPALKVLAGDWTWANFSKFAGNAKPEKDPNSKNRYMLTVALADNKHIEHSVTFFMAPKKNPMQRCLNLMLGVLWAQQTFFSP